MIKMPCTFLNKYENFYAEVRLHRQPLPSTFQSLTFLLLSVSYPSLLCATSLLGFVNQAYEYSASYK